MSQKHRPSSGKNRSKQQPSVPNQGPGQGPNNLGSEMVCVTLQRPPHFWRFACGVNDSRDLLETLANLADTEDSPLTWDDAELIASQIVLHHGNDQIRTQADPKHAR